ncbi:VWA domain-containing protein [Catellatospora sp. TT07R-123]|uniref:vWA domain-containing protein n=1 Tax=Catellatospora sp. TT07R-123 TaxID=2733863 RepID=UPI001B0B0F00|nr:extracellular solute-binding protein [Catellatospora sp. TT07R-123]GHJ42845.1 VWA domain-containing protein [Catellatospora sp. TT07R-123]
MAPGRSTARRWLPVAVAVVVGVAVIAGSYAYVRLDTDRSDCVALDVLSSTEKNVLVAELADRYDSSRRRFGGRCADVTVSGLTSGAAMEALAGDWSAQTGGRIPRPQVWLPTSSLWTGQLRLRDQAAKRAEQTPGSYPSIANSPLVIAMPATKAKVLQQRGLGWGDILGMSGEEGWGAFGKPEWKRFTFGKDNPRLSTSGLAATIATYYAATGTSSDLTGIAVRQPEVTQFVRRIEANVSHYSDDSVDLLRSLAAADLSRVDGAGADLSAIVMQEELVYLYNEGRLSPHPGDRPHEPLVAIYPKEGTFNLDHPYVVLPDASDAQRAAAADFLAFLQEEPQQRAFAGLGFRDHERVATPELTAAVGGHEAVGMPYFLPPAPAVVQEILDSWATLRKKANILMTVDVSGSMVANTVGAHTRLEVATAAAAKGLRLLNSEDRVGLWSFSSEKQGSGDLPYREQIPLSRLDLGAFTDRLDGLQAGGATALYATVRAAHRYLLDHYDRNRINAVVVLTDGENEYAKDDNLASLLKAIELDPDRPVKVFCIAFDKGSDLKTLDAIAKATAGKAFDAQDPQLIDEAFVKLLSSF